jgi:formate dehydrogenase major subunit
MLEMTINGLRTPCTPGETILDVAKRLKIEIPTLCHDDRIKPTGACRLCVVEVRGQNQFPAACHTLAADGMEVLTGSPAVEASRSAILRLLARDYPPDAMQREPDKPFHHWLRRYVIKPQGDSAANHHFVDCTHPLLHIDMRQCITCFRCVRICEEVQGQFVWRAWHRGAATRILPGKGGALLDSACVSCGACADTCPTGAIEDASVLQEGAPNEWTRTVCPYCGTGCEMMVGTKHGKIVQVKPAEDAPVNKGHLCVKGRYAFEFNQSHERITHPMLRDKNGWRVVSWDDAIQFIASRLSEIIRTAGPDSIGMLGSARGTNEENYVAQKFARVVLGTNNVDCCARVCHAPTAAAMNQMLGTGAATNSFDDIERAGCILLCGCNPTEAHPVIGARIKQAVLRGAQLIVIDPRATELAQCADVHLPIRPGTNVPILNALAHVIVAEGLSAPHDSGERVAGKEEFAEVIRRWSPEFVAPICGVSADQIRKAARLYARSAPAMIFHGLGVTEHVQGTEGVMGLVNLALLTGNFGKPGSGVNPLRGQNNVQGAAHMGCEPERLPGFVPLESGRSVFEAAWQTKLPKNDGLNLMQMIDAAEIGELKALWAIGYDVAFTNPATLRTRAALENLDLVIVQDLFLNVFASEFADVFLPAASSFEKDGTFMNAERRVQRVRQTIPPPGEARPDWEIVCDVARAMGVHDGFDFANPGEIWEEIRSVWKAGAGITYARLEETGLQWPCPDESHPGTTILHTHSFATSPTAQLQCLEFHESSERANDEYPFLLTTGRSLFHFNAGTMTGRTPVSKLAPADRLDISPQDAARLGLAEGDSVRVVSRCGSATAPAHIDDRMRSGELYASFHAPQLGINQVIGSGRDRTVLTPEYKRAAVRIEKIQA